MTLLDDLTPKKGGFWPCLRVANLVNDPKKEWSWDSGMPESQILGFRDAGIPDIRFLGSRIPGFWPPFWTILDPFLDTSGSPRAKSAPKWALPETDPSGSPPPTSSLDPPGGYSPLARYYPKKGSFLDHFWSKIGQNPKNPRRETVGFFRSRRESSIVEETTVHFLIVISARARGKPPTPKSGQNRKNRKKP